MKMKQIANDTQTRRQFCRAITLAIAASALVATAGCSVFKGKSKVTDDQSNAFDVDEDEEDESEKEDVFAKERKKQREMSDFLAENGRDSKSKKSKVRPGDDFLLSSKAKEIYANTER